MADVLHLRQLEIPTVTDDGVLVKVHAASVNAADYHLVHRGPDRPCDAKAAFGSRGRTRSGARTSPVRWRH